MDEKEVEKKLALFCNDCPYLRESDDTLDATCTKYNEDLVYYDWWWKCGECYDGTYEGKR